MDLGECPRTHDLALRADYQLAANSKDYFYDVDAAEHLKAFIDDCDRRTELAKKRLAETQEELSAEVSSKAEKVHELAEAIGKKLALAEQAGAEGKVDESIKLMEEVEDIRKKKAMAEIEYRNSMPASSYQQQKLRVCEVCSAYLGIHDNDRRLADHFGGKLHLGFIKIREKLDNLLKNHEERKTKRREARLRESAYGPTDGGRPIGGRGYDYGRERERERERDLDREDRRRADMERRRGGDRERDYSERDYGDRDYDRRYRKSRSRSRSRDRDNRRRRRSRSRSRDRKSHKKRRSSRSRSKESSRRHRDSGSKRDSRSKSRHHSRSVDRDEASAGKHSISRHDSPDMTSSASDSDMERTGQGYYNNYYD